MEQWRNWQTRFADVATFARNPYNEKQLRAVVLGLSTHNREDAGFKSPPRPIRGCVAQWIERQKYPSHALSAILTTETMIRAD